MCISFPLKATVISFLLMENRQIYKSITRKLRVARQNNEDKPTEQFKIWLSTVQIVVNIKSEALLWLLFFLSSCLLPLDEQSHCVHRGDGQRGGCHVPGRTPRGFPAHVRRHLQNQRQPQPHQRLSSGVCDGKRDAPFFPVSGRQDCYIASMTCSWSSNGKNEM